VVCNYNKLGISSIFFSKDGLKSWVTTEGDLKLVDNITVMITMLMAQIFDVE
jgi:hypothetical protein